jgi:RNA polymerase sigma factor (sigma-70 family)
MSKRSNQEWLEELCGHGGYQAQALAHEDLASYLHTVAYNYLLTRQAKTNPQILVRFAPLELATLAEDFVQETLEKLAKNDFALLDKFKGEGKFTSWVAVIVRRQAAQELRKSYWNRRISPPQERWSPNGHDQSLSVFERFSRGEQITPEKAVMQQEVTQALLGCLGGLKESHRLALLGLVVEGLGGDVLARLLNRPTSNAIYTLVGRTKRKLRACLEKAGWEQDVLEIFAESRHQG